MVLLNEMQACLFKAEGKMTRKRQKRSEVAKFLSNNAIFIIGAIIILAIVLACLNII